MSYYVDELSVIIKKGEVGKQLRYVTPKGKLERDYGCGRYVTKYDEVHKGVYSCTFIDQKCIMFVVEGTDSNFGYLCYNDDYFTISDEMDLCIENDFSKRV